jgi:diguanylate cyclase (GGDEF)-like protein/PAS domain S-box-containing protein
MAATQVTEIELFSLAGNDGQLREVNESFARLLELPLEEANGRSLLELVHPEDIEQVVAGLAALEGGAPEVMMESRFLQKSGRHVYLQWVARPLPGTDLWWAAGRDTTEFHRLLNDSINLKTRLDLALGQTSAAMWELALPSAVFSWEPLAARIFGIAESALPTTVAEINTLLHDEDRGAIERAIEELTTTSITDAAIRVGSGWEQRHLSFRGKVLSVDRRGRPTHAVGLIVDVTAEKAMEEQLLRMVMSDGLTGVPNRRAFDQSLRSEWRRCKRELKPLTVMMVDIDNFKTFNDTYGHLIGDEALCAVARALSGQIHREGDVVARFGGEEFAVVLPGTDITGARTVGDRLVEAVRSIELRQAPHWSLGVSIGTATMNPDSDPIKATELLSHADEALYCAKNSGKNRAITYEETLS